MIVERLRRAAPFRLRGLGPATAAAAVVLSSTACGDEQPTQPDPDPVGFEWDLPAGFPTPRVPENDPMTAEKVALGRHLFYDERMSGNETMSCASCHAQPLSFTDGRALAVGSTGDVLPRSSMSLANIAYSPVLTWGNHTQTTLTEQMLIPMFAEDPVELGLAGEGVLLDRLRADATYQSLFAEAYPDDTDPFTLDNVTRAIASFERVLISGNSPEVAHERCGHHREVDQHADDPGNLARGLVGTVVEAAEYMGINRKKEQGGTIHVGVAQHVTAIHVAHDMLDRGESQVSVRRIMHHQHDAGCNLQNEAERQHNTPDPHPVQVLWSGDRQCRVQKT
jgi:hypothetical protein